MKSCIAVLTIVIGIMLADQCSAPVQEDKQNGESTMYQSSTEEWEIPVISSVRLDGPEADGAVLTAGPQGSFDSTWLGWADADYDGCIYRLWYGGSRVQPGYSGDVAAIGLATSEDGLHWQRASGGEPVFEPGAPGAFDEQQVGGPCVLRDGQVWRMWYHGLRKPSGPGTRDMNFRIGIATSQNGVLWTRENGGHPVLDLGPEGSFDDTQVANPAVVREQRGYRMWYSAYSTETGHTIGIADSPDGIHWTKFEGGKPVEGLGRWVLGPAVYRHASEYVMLYSRENKEEHPELYAWFVAAAVSRDGFHWRVLNGGKPIAGFGPNPPPAGGGVHHPTTPVGEGPSLRYWYTEHLAPGVFRIAAGKVDFSVE